MPSVLGYSQQEIEEAPRAIPVNRDPRGIDGAAMVQLLDYEKDLERQKIQDAEALAQEQDFGFFSHAGKAFVQESIIANGAAIVSDAVEPFDVTYTPEVNQQDLDTFAVDMPPWAVEDLRRAKSSSHFHTMLGRVQKQHDYNMEAEYLGGVSMAAEMAGILVNPETLLFGIGEAALLTKFAIRGGTKVLAAGGIAAVSNMGQELVIMENNNSRSELGLILAGAAGFGFGGIVGGLSNRAISKEEALLHKMSAEDIAESIKADVDVALAKPNPLAKSSTPQSVGAAAASADDIPIDTFDLKQRIPFLKKHIQRIKSVRPKFMQSVATMGLNSENGVERQVYNALVEHAPGTGGKRTADHSAFLRGEVHTMSMRSRFNIARENGWNEWKSHLKANGQWERAVTTQADFDDEVFEEITRRFNGADPNPDLHPSIKAVADARVATDELRFNILKGAGVEGYDKIDYIPNMLSHQWDSNKMFKASRLLRDEGHNPREFMVNLLRRSILGGGEFSRKDKYAALIKAGRFTDEFKENTAKAQAEAIYDRFIKRPVRGGSTHTTLLTKKERVRFEKAVKTLADKADDPAAYKSVMSSLDPGDQRALNELLSQIHLDANLEIGGVAVRDMLDTTMGRNLDTQFRKDGGRAGMAELGIDSESTFLELKEAVVAEELNIRGGAGIKDVQKFGDQKSEELIALYKMILGENIEKDPSNAAARVGRGLRQMATLSAMNQVGFAQTAEMGRLASTIGVKSMFRNIFEMGKLRRDMVSGKLKDPILQDLEAVSGVRLGDNHLLEHPKLRADAGGHTLAHEDSPAFLRMLDSAMQKGLHVQGYINGMNMIMRFQHRAHAKGTMMRMFDELRVKGIDSLSTARKRRYADMGLSENDLQKISKNMETHSVEAQGWFNQKRLGNANIRFWDSDIREKIVLALHKSQAQAIQRNMVGETPLWMESSFGKLLTQFRTFPIVALEKQLIHDMKHLDVEAFMTSVYSLGIASSVYMAATYANSFGLDKRKRRKFLKNRLNPAAVAQGAINWSGQASLIPDAMNVAGSVFGVNPFQYTQNKGAGFRRAGDLKLGTAGPGLNYINSGYRFATGLGHATMTGEELTSSTFRHGTRLIPFNNAIGMRNLINVFGNNFD